MGLDCLDGWRNFLVCGCDPRQRSRFGDVVVVVTPCSKLRCWIPKARRQQQLWWNAARKWGPDESFDDVSECFKTVSSPSNQRPNYNEGSTCRSGEQCIPSTLDACSSAADTLRR